MKNLNDIGSILDEIFKAAQEFSENFKDMNFKPDFKDGNKPEHGPNPFQFWTDESTDYYPAYSYPPMNVYLTPERGMVFEFAVSGFDEKDISLSFQGDYMSFSAKINPANSPMDGVHYFKRRLKLKDIERQKYYVPNDKFAQESVRAIFKNGILKVMIPPKDITETPEGIKIEIVKEGE
jgi:HSP20 family protein